MESYKKFAVIYDELMNDVNYEDWFNYIKRIFRENDMEPQRILEIACGTGNLTKLFCEERYDVTCFDLSEDMLTIAYNKLRKYRNVLVIKQDMVNFQLNKKFGAIVSICDSLNYILYYDDLVKVFKNVYSHLDDGGIFIFDINSYYKLNQIISNNTFVNDNDKIFYVWENHFNEDDRIVEFYLTFFVKEGENYIRFNEQHIQRAYKEEEVRAALKEAGFKSILVFDAFTFNKPKSNSERINFVIKK